VLCIGGGPAGLSIAQVARARGARHIYISDPSPLARSVIAGFPEFVCIDPQTQPIRDAVDAGTCTAVFDTVGTAETTGESLSLLAETGTYVNLAVHDTQLTLNPTALGSERIITTSSNALYRDEREAHSLISSGAVNMRSMITHRFPLDEYQKAFDLLLRDPKEAYKVVFEIGQ
jgi:threonine dehydrogenase-like Zn-dependent dehydrogenase